MSLRALVRQPQVQDALLALAFTGAIAAGMARIDSGTAEGRSLDVAGWLLIVVAGAALAFRRRYVLGTLAVTTATMVLYGALDYPGGPAYVAVLIAIYTVAAQEPRGRAIALALASTGAIFLAGVAARGTGFFEGWIHLFFLSWAGAALFLGDAMRNRRRYLESLEARAREAEQTREEEASRRVAEERLRIARDVHDILAHNLATISVQAGAAEHVFDQQPEQARLALGQIRTASKEALAQLRTTLETLRQEGESLPRNPLPGLRDLDELVENARRGGLDVAVDVTGTRVDLAPATDHAAYRIVQEALTNVMRHADARATRLALRYGAEALEIEVADEGRGPVGSNGAGHGLRGMQERAANAGGTLEYGPRPDGGFRVMARLPVAGA